MIVTTIFDDRIETLLLPDHTAGYYPLPGGTSDGMGSTAAIDGGKDGWVLTISHPPSEVPLSCPDILSLQIGSRRILLLTEAGGPEHGRFSKVRLPADGRIRIGRDTRCDICFNSIAMSARHALLLGSGGRYRILDEGSTNGVYVNGRRVSCCPLHPGDLIFIAGLRLIFCGDHLAAAPSDGRITCSSRLTAWHLTLIPSDSAGPPSPVTDILHRPPRFRREIRKLELKIDPPPSPPSADELPFPLVMASSLSMGMVSVVMLFSAVTSGNTASILMGAAMLTGTLLVPAITRQFEHRRRKQREKRRLSRYREYLREKRAVIAEAAAVQETILRENAPSAVACLHRILQKDERLWERSIRHSDRLLVRAGLGEAGLSAELTGPERRFSIDEDPLQKDLDDFCESPRKLSEVPVTWSLADSPVSGVCGNRDAVLTFVRSLLLQLTALYDSSQLRLALACGPDWMRALSWVRLLPHVWNEDHSCRFLAETADELNELAAQVGALIETRAVMREEEQNDAAYYVFFFPDPGFVNGTALFQRLTGLRKDLHISVVACGGSLPLLPKESRVVSILSPDSSRLIDRSDLSNQGRVFSPDPVPSARLLSAAAMLANLRTGSAARMSGYPSVLPFLRLYGAGRLEHLNCADRWRESDPSRSLAALIGLDAAGNPLSLDLHERFHGPHALIAGMTGSGKSEWIITYILSLSVCFSPQELSFVLIDYKGGGMAGAFTELPHTAGILTNLDGSAIARTLISLESELKRRQQLFASAARAAGTGSIDIYGYQRRFREGRIQEPLSHLFVICDEFAELKTKHPEFMEQLISTARIGRSLGVHLILATQKPGGVVDDQIQSNSRARICLKVQDRGDSMEMLGRPDAAALSSVGRFYLQVDGGELFLEGQAAWAGAPYLPSDTACPRHPAVSVLSLNARVIKRISPAEEHASADGLSQQDALIRFLRQTAEAGGLSARPLWLPPLPERILLRDLRLRYPSCPVSGLAPLLGEADDPAGQRRFLLRLPLSERGHAVLFGSSDSGITEALYAILTSAVTESSPELLWIYLLDYADGALAAFLPAPHVGGLVTVDSTALLQSLIRMIRAELEYRKQCFLPCGGNYEAFLASGGPLLPRILLVISGYPAFAECQPEEEEDLSRLMQNCCRYGIHLLCTAGAGGSIRYRSVQNFSVTVTFHQNDPSEYSLILGSTGGLQPGSAAGRGLIRLDGIYEFQTASVCGAGPSFPAVRQLCEELAQRHSTFRAKPIPSMPDRITLSLLETRLSADHPLLLPIGYDCDTLEPGLFDFGARVLTPILASGAPPVSFFLLISRLFIREELPVLLLDPRERLPLVTGGRLRHLTDASVCAEALSALSKQGGDFAHQKEEPARGLSSVSFCSVLLFPVLSDLLDRPDETLSSAAGRFLEMLPGMTGITVIFGDTAQELAAHSYEKWFRSGFSSWDGIWLGSGFPDQFLLRSVSRIPEELPDSHAVCLSGGSPAVIRLPDLSETAGIG